MEGKRTRFTLPVPDDSDTVNVEVTNETVSVNGGLTKKPSFGSSIVRNGSSKIKLTRRHGLVGKFDRSKSKAAVALKGLKFISKTDAQAWMRVEKQFDELTAKTNGILPRSLFGQCIGMNTKDDKDIDKLFAGQLFDALCRRFHISISGGGSITKTELRQFWDIITDQDYDSRLQIFFDMVDQNGDGRISEEEIKEVITSSAAANHLSNIQDQADEFAKFIMEELDPDNLGYIMIEDLKTLLQEGTEQARQGESQALSKVLGQKLRRQEYPLIRWYKGLSYFLVDNWRRVWVLALWIGVMAGLFAYKYVEYKNREAFQVMGRCVCMAKGAAETLKLNMALILLPMCRNTITWLRNKTRLGAVIPFDDNINFHQIIAVAIGIGVGIHTISHFACDFPRLLNADAEKYKPMDKFFGDQPTSYWFFVKGWEGVTGIIMVILMAIAFTLASPWFRNPKPKMKKKDEKPKKDVEKPNPLMKKLTGFNAFWYSHHLFIIVYTLLIIHGIKLYLTHHWYKKTTWMYLAIPLLIYVGERLTRAFRSNIKEVKILKVAVYPGNVVALHMSKPQGFKYKSGQYMFVKCAAVSPFEWHPFSITSAPKDNYLSVHIRALGDWTRQIKHDFIKVCEAPPKGVTGPHTADFLEGENNPSVPRVMIDGPYGAPTQEYKKYDVVLLIGLGIGATPMISVLKDIANNMKEMEDEEEGKGKGNINPFPHSSFSKRKMSPGHDDFKTRKAYFYWMTREQYTFDWFKTVMNEVDEMDYKGAIEMHNYCTSVYEEGDARSTLITMLQTMNLAKKGVDIVTGTKAKSHFARPNWKAVYQNISDNHPRSTIGVFYCGAPAPVKELRELSSEFSRTTTTRFEFHKENF